MKEHKIQWLNEGGRKGETWNPIVGCSKESEGCKNCYAERMAIRQWWMRFCHADNPYNRIMKIGYSGAPTGWDGKTEFVESAIDKPLHWRKPRNVFVCSMGDLFHESVSYVLIDRVFNQIAACPQHTFQILTKRAERYGRLLSCPP